MAAPISQQFSAALKASFITQGFVLRVVDANSGELVPAVPPQLTPEGAKMVQAISDAMASVWLTWQGSQVVDIPVTSAEGSPSIGNLP